MKEEALKLADELEKEVMFHDKPEVVYTDVHRMYASQMIRRLVEELDEKNYRILELTKRYKALTWNDKQSEPVVYWDGKHFASREKSSLADIPLYTTPQTKPLKRLNKQEIARYMFSQNTGQDIGQMLIEYFCDKNGLTLEYIED